MEKQLQWILRGRDLEDAEYGGLSCTARNYHPQHNYVKIDITVALTENIRQNLNANIDISLAECVASKELATTRPSDEYLSTYADFHCYAVASLSRIWNEQKRNEHRQKQSIY